MQEIVLLKLILIGAVGFIMVTMVLYVLANHLDHAIRRHDLIREARLKREEYLQNLARLREPLDEDVHAFDQADIPDGPYNVDVIDDALPQAA